jgi:hypothetical protein
MMEMRLDNQTSRAALRAFEGHATWVWMVYMHFEVLYGTEEARTVLRNSAPDFFGELQNVLIHYILLQMCALTDPSTSTVRGQKLENLTINNLADTIEWTPTTQAVIKSNVARLNEIVEPIREARNKIIAHSDKDTALTDKTHGAFPKGHDALFFDLLAEVVNAMHEELFGGPFDIKVADATGPASDLILRLRELTQSAEG